MTNDYVLVDPPKGLAINDAILALAKGQAYAFPASHKPSLTSRVSSMNKAHRLRHWRTYTDRLRFQILVICDA